MVSSANDASLSMKVNLYISGRNLKNLDTFSKSDPICRVYEKKQSGWVKMGSTEQIKDNLNPNFEQCLQIGYYFEKKQELKFEMIDDDGNGDYDLIGECYTNMGAVMGAKMQMFQDKLVKGGSNNSQGNLIVRAEAVQASNTCARFKFRWQNLNNLSSGFIGIGRKRMGVRFEIGRAIPGTSNFAEIFCTRTIKQQSPDFDVPLQSLSLQKLCNNNRGSKIRFSVWDRRDKMINEVQVSIEDIENGPKQFDAKEGAQLVLQDWELYEKPSFVDYLRSGWQISIVGAIDYTASNGNPSSSQSLHYLGANNQYEAATWQVGQVIEPYDSDKMFPFFGFGGIPRHMGINGVNHCFAMNGNPSNPEIFTIQNVLATYRSTLPQIGLGGPTLFAPLLQQFKMCVQATMQQGMVYQILLLLTDGTIHDMPQTKTLIVELSSMPCSVIIVGVGNADFGAMEELDGDGGVLRDDRGYAVQRDIVQFVEYNECMKKGDLAEQVLKEVPDQVCSYMEKQNFQAKAVVQDYAALDGPPQ